MSFLGNCPEAAILAWWNGTPAVQALTSDGKLWFKEEAEAQNPQPFPYATFFRVSDLPETTTTGFDFRRCVVQFNLHANTPNAASAMGNTLRKLIRNAPLVINGSDIMHLLPDGSAIQKGVGLGPGGRDCWVAIETFELPYTSTS